MRATMSQRKSNIQNLSKKNLNNQNLLNPDNHLFYLQQ